MTTLALTSDLWDELVSTLERDVETAGFILAGQARDEDRLVLLGRRVVWIPDTAYMIRERRRLEIGSAGFVPALKAGADDQCAVVFFHSHPGGGPSPSKYDDEVDRLLAGPAQIRTGQELYGSLILGGDPQAPSFSGRVLAGGRTVSLERLRVVGNRIRLLTQDPEQQPEEVFDRQIRAFGSQGQAVLRALRVGIVGAGGTGSAVFELLTRLGVGDITVIDDDEIDPSNLTRVHESRRADIGTAKVATAATAAERIGLGTNVRPVRDRITKRDAAASLRHCDVVFGCTDDNGGRAVLSRLAYWYLVPVLDTAFMVDTDDRTIRGLFGRITVLQPGTPCLFCRGRIDERQLMAEGLSDAERARLAEEGYVPGLGDPAPSVGAYTTLVAATAVTELLERLFGFAEEAPPSELLLRLHEREVNSLSGVPRPGHYCADRTKWGRGDEDPLLGLLWPDSDAG